MYFARYRRQAANPVFRRRCWSLGNPGREVPPGLRHGAPAAWLDAKGTYLICPMLRRRYLASLSFSRFKRQEYAKRKGVEHFAFLLLCLKG